MLCSKNLYFTSFIEIGTKGKVGIRWKVGVYLPSPRSFVSVYPCFVVKNIQIQSLDILIVQKKIRSGDGMI